MRSPLFLLLFILLPVCSFSTTHSFHIGWGGLQPRYFYPHTDLEWNAEGLLFPNTGLQAGIRSIGTFYFFSTASYDLHLFAVCRLTKFTNGQIAWENSALIGGGYFLMLRKEAAGYGGFYPSIIFRSVFIWNGLTIRADVLTKWYSDGFAFGLFPEVSWVWGWFGVYIRSEPLFTSLYSFANSEWSWNNIAGLMLKF